MYRRKVEEDLQILAIITDEYHVEANKSEGKMQSRYDTDRESLSSVANALQQIVNEKNRKLLDADSNENKTAIGIEEDVINIGSIVTFFDQEFGEKSTILLLPEQLSGGESLEIEGFAFTGVNAKTPLATALLGKKTGDSLQYEVNNYPIKIDVIMVI